MSRRHVVPVAVLALALATRATAQLVVQGGGAALQQALAAAAPGAVLDVMPGAYTEATATRGVHVALRPGATVASQQFPTQPSLTVQSLPAGEHFVVSGGAVRGIAALQCAGEVTVADVDLPPSLGIPVVRIDGCSGPVVLDRLRQLTSTPLPLGSVDVTNSAQVSMRACWLPRVLVTASHVALSAVVVPVSQGFVPGLRVTSGTVSIDGGELHGSATASWPTAWPGLQVDAGDVLVTGGARIAASPAHVVLPMAAIVANGGTLRLDPSVVLVGTTPVSGPVPVQTLELPSLTATTIATTLGVATTAEPNAILVTFASLPQPPVPTPWGEAWLLPTDPILDVAVLGAAGTGAFQRTFATVPPLTRLVLQSVSLSAQNPLVVGAPLRLVWR